ncbi:MAG: hypothetical protein ACTSYF_07020 [Promethearchaeota archaeon]
MANTKISDIGSTIAIDPVACKTVTGTLDADTKPGQYVVMVGGVWVKVDADTASHKLLRGGVVEFRKRKNDDGGVPTIDANYDIDNEPALAKVGIITRGPVNLFIEDQSGTVYPGTPFGASSTAGSLTAISQEATGATSGTGLRRVTLAILKEKVVSGDTVGKFDLVAWEVN